MRERKAFCVQGLTKVYPGGVVANEDIHLEILAGEVLGLVGPNGAGKTTLLRQLIGLLRPTRGRIELFGHDVVARPEIVPHYVGYCGQGALALRAHKLWEVPYFTGLLRGQRRVEAKRQAFELLERFELSPLADRLLAHVSGGERRLAVLLSTFMSNPPVLVLDEPSNELDPKRRRLLWDFLRELNQQQGTTILLATHNLLEAERAVQRVAILDRGRLIALGTPGELKRQVEDRVWVEVRLRPGIEGDVLHSFPEAVCLGPDRWQIRTASTKVISLLKKLLERLDGEAIDDLRLMSPTLEDVYLHVTGRVWKEDGNSHER